MNFIEFSKWKKRFIAFFADTLAAVLSWLSAGWLASTFSFNLIAIYSILPSVVIQCLFFITCGLYRGIWRFASIPDLIRILQAVVVGTIVNVLIFGLNNPNFSLRLYIVYPLFLVTLLAGSRFLYRWLRDYRRIFRNGKKVLVVGAGSAGEGLIRDLKRSFSNYNYQPVVFVDDDPNKQGFELQGVRVAGTCKDINKIVKTYAIELIIIAVPSAPVHHLREIVKYCEETKIPFRTLPSLKDLADGIVKINALREVELEDLLGRQEVYHDWELIRHAISNKSVMVTGAGGSIGSELCRQICQLAPAKLIIIDNNEFNLYSIDLELRQKNLPIQIITHLCNITDKQEMQKIFANSRPELVFHVAAYKHVPLLESHIRVAMFNNIIGTKTVAECADKAKVKTFVLISTDKAVNPTSVMGATKRASEVFCQNFNLHSKTHFITVRFGNVLDSAGSVIPLFRRQLLAGGPLTVTHRDITRYFMTIPEAAQLILQAITIKNQGGIFVLDMGEPIKIRYLAEQIIKLSGRTDVGIVYTGLRPGEKLHEELFHHQENIHTTSHPKIKYAKVRYFDWQMLTNTIKKIEAACSQNDEEELKHLLVEIVPEYQQAEGLVERVSA